MLNFGVYIALINTFISTDDYIDLLFKCPIYFTIITKLHKVIWQVHQN